MRRLRTTLLVALGTLLGVIVLTVGTLAVVFKTDRGNAWVRGRVVRMIEGRLGANGTVTLGRLALSPLGSVSLDTLALRDPTGALVFASGPVHARFTFGPLLGREVHLEEITIARPQAHLVQDRAGAWNVGKLFADTLPEPEDPNPRPWRLRLDSLVLAHGLVTIARPDSLPSLPPRTAQYAGLQVVLGESRYDLGSREGAFLVHELAADIESPPVLLRHAEGSVWLWGDSVRVALPAIRLRETRGALEGTIAWADPDADARLALLLRADSLAFRDIAWITPLVPDSGGGRAIVRITNGPRRGITRYAVDSIDAFATASRFSGRFVADVGDTVAIRDVDVRLAPLDLALLDEILGEAVLDSAWDGALEGRVVAPGGPLNAWQLDTSVLVYEDRRLGGTRSRVAVSGRLDLMADPMVLGPLDIRLDSVDVRTVGAVVSRADSLDGFVRGGVSLGGPLENFRFDGLELLLTDSDGRVSHMRGAGRVALDTATTWLEAQLIVDSASVGSLGPAVTPRRLRGAVAGFFSAAARGDSIAMELALEGEDAFLQLSGATSTDSARLVFKGDATMETFDARRFLVDADLPPHLLTARARIGLDGDWSGPSGPLEITIDSTSQLAGLELREGRASLVLEPGGLRIDTLAFESATGRVSARGHLSRDPLKRDTVRFEATIDSLGHVADFLPDSVAEAVRDTLGGKLEARGTIVGSLDTIAVAVDWRGEGLYAGTYAVQDVRGLLRLGGVPRAPVGTATVEASGVSLGGIGLATLASQAEIRSREHIIASAQATLGDTLAVRAHGELRNHPDSLRVVVDTLEATSRWADWSLVAPTSVFSDARRVVTDTIALASTDGALARFHVAIDTTGPVSGSAMLQRMPVRHARFTGVVPEGWDGLLSMQATFGGTMDAPTIDASATLDSGIVNERLMPQLVFEGDYADRRFEIDLRGRSLGREEFALTGTLPLDLRLRAVADRLRKDDELYLRLVANATSLTYLNGVAPGITDIEGGIDADLLVAGTWGDYQPRGIFLLRDGAFTVPTLRTRFRDLLMDVSLAPDSITLHRVRLADEFAANDTAALEGAIAFRDGAWRAEIVTMARRLRIMDNPRVAVADISWELGLRGRLDSLVLSGTVDVPEATAYIADNRDVLLLDEDLAAAEQRRRYIPRIDSLTVRLGNEVRLRSPDANVQLTGEFDVAGNLQSPDVRGELQATRGTYRLAMGLLQRTFQVDSGVVRVDGVMRPDGTSDNPPRLDIHASYLVRQADRENVRIGARITGTTQAPRISLYSADLGSTANETEIISYMLFGAPSFALDDRSGSALRTATAALVPSLGGAVEKVLGGQIPWISDLQVTTVAGDTPSDFSLKSFGGLLNSLALTAGKQAGPDGYLSLSTGVCRGDNPAARSLPIWFGFTAEYRPRERLSAQLSLSPGLSPCNRIGAASQIYQVGLDLFRDWRW